MPANKHTIMRIPIRKSVSCQVYKHPVTSSSSSSSTDSSGSSSSSENLDTPLKRFNRILRSSVARHWSYFRKDRPGLVRSRGRSISDAGLCSIIDNDLEVCYLGIPPAKARRSLYAFGTQPAHLGIPALYLTSAGSGAAAHQADEASDSDADRPRRHHLRVPTPAFHGQSTGNFCASGGGGGGAPRSAPATPLQLHPSHPSHPVPVDSHPRSKHDKHAVKPLSGSAPSVRTGALTAASDSAEGSKAPSKARQKKFQRHFPQVGPEERVLNYYSCALVGDLLLQGHLYITKNYFAFYSNVFGYVTKLLIPIVSVLRITKEKVARIIPNAVGVCTRDERHVFGSLLSRDATYKLMTHVWKAHRPPDHAAKPAQELRASEAELDASEYSPEDDSSSGGAEAGPLPSAPAKREPEALLGTAFVPTGAAVIQPALLTGAPAPLPAPSRPWRAALLLLAALLVLSAAVLACQLLARGHSQEELLKLSGEELYSELLSWRSRLHGRAATELHAFLSTNLLLLSKVRQSLEALSGVILKDIAAGDPAYGLDPPYDTVFS